MTVNIPVLGRENGDDNDDDDDDDRYKKSCRDSQQGPSKTVVNVVALEAAVQVVVVVVVLVLLLLPILLVGIVNDVKENACTFPTATNNNSIMSSSVAQVKRSNSFGKAPVTLQLDDLMVYNY
jgi:hypothetical protein